jgi:hypothetical protein
MSLLKMMGTWVELSIFAASSKRRAAAFTVHARSCSIFLWNTLVQMLIESCKFMRLNKITWVLKFELKPARGRNASKQRRHPTFGEKKTQNGYDASNPWFVLNGWKKMQHPPTHTCRRRTAGGKRWEVDPIDRGLPCHWLGNDGVLVPPQTNRWKHLHTEHGTQHTAWSVHKCESSCLIKQSFSKRGVKTIEDGYRFVCTFPTHHWGVCPQPLFLQFQR